jgi:SAM-dependent methyltransferase
MQNYYAENLAAERLRSCYDLAPPRVKAYLEAEIDFVLRKTSSSMIVLELGCGYGRVLRRVIPQVRVAVGVDTSFPSLGMARGFLGGAESVHLAQMDARLVLGFATAPSTLRSAFRTGSPPLGLINSGYSRRLFV